MGAARHSEKAWATARKLRAEDRLLENDFVSDEEFAGFAMRGSATWPAC